MRSSVVKDCVMREGVRKERREVGVVVCLVGRCTGEGWRVYIIGRSVVAYGCINGVCNQQ